jgi:hypothetical protein
MMKNLLNFYPHYRSLEKVKEMFIFIYISLQVLELSKNTTFQFYQRVLCCIQAFLDPALVSVLYGITILIRTAQNIQITRSL